MPGLNGFEVCNLIMVTQKYWFESMKKQQTLVKFKARKVCPVVAVTAFRDASIETQAAKVGMKAVLHKPIITDKLIEVLNNYL